MNVTEQIENINKLRSYLKQEPFKFGTVIYEDTSCDYESRRYFLDKKGHISGKLATWDESHHNGDIIDYKEEYLSDKVVLKWLDDIERITRQQVESVIAKEITQNAVRKRMIELGLIKTPF